MKTESKINNEEVGMEWLTDLQENSPSMDEIRLKNYNESYKVNKKLLPTKKCDRCSGHGRIQSYVRVNGGVCFKCKGSGKM